MGIVDILGGIFSPIKDIVGEVVVDPNKRDQVNLELSKLEAQAQQQLNELTQGQLDINKVEAGSQSLFVAGWRPAVGWIGGIGLLYSVLVQPLGSWVARLCGYLGTFPAIDNQLLLYILGGMLGLGTMRTVEKLQGVATTSLSAPAPKPQDTTVAVKPTGEVVVDKSGAPPDKPKRHFHIF